MPTRTPCLVPTPKRVTSGEGAFPLGSRTTIVLPPEAGDADHRAARQLQHEVHAATGLRPPVLKVARLGRPHDIIVLVSDPTAAERLLGEPLHWEDLERRGDEAHLVEVTPRRIVAGGRGSLALHLAVQTLRQIARVEGALWPAQRIVDWPALRYRGLMLDVSRGKVPTVETLKRIVDVLSLYKGNVFQLYTEHTFQFPLHPRIGAGCGALCSDDILELDAYARERQVELMPNLQSFGHCAHILNLPEYAHLAEASIRWSLCPSDEGTYDLLDDLYAGLLPSFTSRTINVDCDETWDLGKGRTAKEATAPGAAPDTGRLYLEHIKRLHDLAARHGRRVQLWGDIMLHHPELVGELPDDVTLLDWHYEAATDYPSVRQFAASGRDYWVCPGTSSWNTLFPRIDNSNANIRTLVRQGAEHGASGMLNTDWGDNGHYQPTGQCWYGYVFGLEQAWSGGTTPDEAFDPRFGRLLFGVGGERVVGATRDLGRLNTLPGMAHGGNASRSVYMLLEDPLVGDSIAALSTDALEQIVETCARAERTLRGAIATSRAPLSLEEMVYSARLVAYAAKKVRASKKMIAALTGLDAGETPPETLRAIVRRLQALDAELVPLVDTLRDLWLRRARYSEMGISLGHFEGLRGRYRIAAEWLAARAEELEAGGMPSQSLVDYRREARSYEILGEGFWRRWRELDLGGAD